MGRTDDGLARMVSRHATSCASGRDQVTEQGGLPAAIFAWDILVYAGKDMRPSGRTANWVKIKTSAGREREAKRMERKR